jgi:hypothetical protein
MHKRRLSASGAALYDGRLDRVMYWISLLCNSSATPKVYSLWQT